MLSEYCEGDARKKRHAIACGKLSPSCSMSCRCWCHGITRHLNGDVRPDWRYANKPRKVKDKSQEVKCRAKKR